VHGINDRVITIQNSPITAVNTAVTVSKRSAGNTHTHTPVDSRRRWHFCEFTALCRRLVPCEHHIGI